ncbi:hypothetical protein [Myxosarcina sp. GI1]|uniref:hypothetical protein n=1 Tax=Myxosarcina sp. GI1 TaxID=1541065 RepID=UPI0005696A47|nr:hypothetical protein [Myxosarcina sp. GI1]
MKNTNTIANTIFAIASSFFITGAVVQNSSLKDLGIGTFIATGLIKQETINKRERATTKQKLTDWQNNIYECLETISRSLESTENELNHKHQELENKVVKSNLQFDRQLQNIEVKLKHHQQTIDKNKQQLKAQEKQQNKMRS